MVADKLIYFRLTGKLSLSLAVIHGAATAWYFLTPDKDAFKEHHGIHPQSRGLFRSIKSTLVTTCPVDCSVNTAILVTAGYLLEQRLGSLFMAKTFFLLFFSSIGAAHLRTLGYKFQ